MALPNDFLFINLVLQKWCHTSTRSEITEDNQPGGTIFLLQMFH